MTIPDIVKFCKRADNTESNVSNRKQALTSWSGFWHPDCL